MNKYRKNKAIFLLFPLLFFTAFFLFGCGGEYQAPPLGSPENPIKIYFTPSVNVSVITSSSNHFIDFMKKQGLHFKPSIPQNFTSVVEAFGSGLADVAIMNSFCYLLAHEKFGATAKMTVIRDGAQHYCGQIITRADSGIKKVEDLQGKSFAFTDSSSTSGFLFPLKIFKEKGIVLGDTTFARQHDTVARMVYLGQVTAGATFYSPPTKDGIIRDARARLLDEFPDIEKKVIILTLTEDIMNDPIVFAADMPQELTEKIIAALNQYIITPDGKVAFKALYSVDGLVESDDIAYNGLRKMLELTETKIEDLM